MIRNFTRLAATLLATPLLAHAAPPVDQRELLNSTLWMQQSVEFRVLTEQVYRDATEHLKLALKPGTAMQEQETAGKFAKLPPAVVLDIDETVLDNSPFEGWRLQTGKSHSEETFREWIMLGRAKAIPGAVAFTQAAAKMGVKVFYVSNRKCAAAAPAPCPDKEATIANLRAHGFPLPSGADSVLLNNERPEWVSDKTFRRQHLMKRYRVIMQVGDDLRDFLPAASIDALRRESAQLDKEPGKDLAHARYRAYFGRRWFLLPNPTYGSWDNFLPRALDQRYALLDAAPLKGPAPAAAPALKLATWNMEWLRGTDVTPEEQQFCATAEGKANIGRCAAPLRTPADYAAIKRYVEVLDADIVALQEVNGAPAAARVFDPNQYDFYFTGQAWVQKAGFAVRKGRGIKVAQNPDVKELGDAEPPNLRWGADITVTASSGGVLRLLAVHLKSGCFDKPLTDTAQNRYGQAPCPILQKQVPVLRGWIAARQAEGVPFALMGDFNRRFNKEPKEATDAAGRPVGLWASIAGADLVAVDAQQPYVGCSTKDRYDAYIDHVVLSGKLAARVVPNTYERIRYRDEDLNFALSDHCPMAVKIAP
jgi:5'-nucleotidase (lipoprotein e(P4) family)